MDAKPVKHCCDCGLNISDIAYPRHCHRRKQQGEVFVGDQRFDIVVRLPEQLRTDLTVLAFTYSLPNGAYVPLEEVGN